MREKMKNGFVLSLDAVLALLVALLMLGIIFSYLNIRASALSSNYLSQISMDALALMEKNGALNDAVAGNSSKANDALRALPPSVCVDLKITDSTGKLKLLLKRPRCGGYEKELITARRSFIYGNDFYIAQAEAWYLTR
ncbi:MAG: hypothetical protein AB1468_06195 [Candidatus Micrarchaeota archaeon]